MLPVRLRLTPAARMLHLRTIGPVSINVGSTVVNDSSPQACAALFFLVVERGKEIPRRVLVDLLFPDATEASGTHALRQLVYRLRKIGAPIEAEGSSVW